MKPITDAHVSRRQFNLAIAGLACASIAGAAMADPNTISKPQAANTDGGSGRKVDGRYTNGECWLDADGRTIQAHGGGMLIHDGVYYWYGEHRDGPELERDGKKSRGAGGVSCYRSTDLVTWKSLGVVLATSDDPTHDLHPTKVLERPKVVYNKTTKKLVLWLHVDSPNYGYARAGVAVADDPAGPFRYIESFRPNNFMSRDQTVFIDRDGHAYHMGASDENATAMISLLTDDYLKPSGKFEKVFAKRSMEAFALTEHDGKYWMLASGCTGWKPNTARSGAAGQVLGPWTELPNPCMGDGSDLTFGGQSAYIIPPGPANREHIAMFDNWRPNELRTSGYTWLPIAWENQRMVIHNQPTWPPPKSG